MSPAVLRLDGFTVFVRLPPREHSPAHVHVRKAGGEVVILLADGSVRSAGGMTDRDIAAARRMVLEYRDDLVRYWEYYHNDGT
jgi:hypothetical protein